ncbi:MAG: MarR family transcriptional regulator [Phenylobacterium sp.]|nr:MAG: MarR family transcriptional regulator [Phenylobacterium sp.]
MHHTRNVDGLAAALIDLMSFFSSPQRDEVLLREAGVELDRALFPLLVRLAMRGPLSVAGLAEQVGRDHTTISRQLAKLEHLGLIARQDGAGDRRVRTASLTARGDEVAQAIAAARRRLLSKALGDWDQADLAQFADLSRRFVDALARPGR